MAGEYDIKILQGSDKKITVVVKDDSDTVINLTGYDARMQVRSNIQSDTVLDELTNGNSRIDITGVEGKLELKFPSDISKNYNFVSAVYDLEIDGGGQVKRILEGKFLISKEVTR